MKKQTLGIVMALCFVTTLATVCVRAQSGMIEGRATIPFDFVVRDQTFMAGEYTIERVTQGKDILMLRRADDSASVMFLTRPADVLANTEQSKLVFRRYGDQYFLSQIWSSNDSTKNELYRCRRERVLVREIAQRTTTTRDHVLVAIQRR